MIDNGGTKKSNGKCGNVKHEMEDYILESVMFSIEMGCCVVFPIVEWLCKLGPVTMDFKDLYIGLDGNIMLALMST
jgi:hypothetical protein